MLILTVSRLHWKGKIIMFFLSCSKGGTNEKKISVTFLSDHRPLNFTLMMVYHWVTEKIIPAGVSKLVTCSWLLPWSPLTAFCLVCRQIYMFGFRFTAPFSGTVASYTIKSYLWKKLPKPLLLGYTFTKLKFAYGRGPQHPARISMEKEAYSID